MSIESSVARIVSQLVARESATLASRTPARARDVTDEPMDTQEAPIGTPSVEAMDVTPVPFTAAAPSSDQVFCSLRSVNVETDFRGSPSLSMMEMRL